MPKKFSKDYQPTKEQKEKANRTRKRRADERKKMREIFEDILTKKYKIKIDGQTQQFSAIEAMCLKQLQLAMNGNTKSFELIRDTIGEKPIENIAINTVSEKDMKEVDDLINKINNEVV